MLLRRHGFWAAGRDERMKAMANLPQVETVSTGADKAKLAVAGLLVVAAVVAFYALSNQDLWMRVAALGAPARSTCALSGSSNSSKQS